MTSLVLGPVTLPHDAKDTEEELIEAFKVFDRDRDGFISGGGRWWMFAGGWERMGTAEIMLLQYNNLYIVEFTIFSVGI